MALFYEGDKVVMDIVNPQKATLRVWEVLMENPFRCAEYILVDPRSGEIITRNNYEIKEQ